MKYFILLFTLLFHTLVYSQLNTSNRTVNQKLYFKAGANFDSLTADRPAYIDSSGDIVSQLLDLTTDVTGVLPLANGGTGSATQNFVDLTTNQSIAGQKTFTDDTAIDASGSGDALAITHSGSGDGLSIDQSGSGAAATITGTVDVTGQINSDNLTLDGNTISSTDTNGNIVLDPNGTGNVNLPDLTISQPAYIDASGNLVSQDIDLSADVTGILPEANGGTGLDASAVTDGQLLIGNTSDNTFDLATITGTTDQVSVTNGNGSITLATPQDIATTSSPTFAGVTSTGDILMSGTGQIDIPVGTTAQRSGSPNSGMLRFNSDTSQFEGYDGSAWGEIGGTGGGGGGLDVFYDEDHEQGTDSSDYTTGLNATFDNGGTLGGALANETTNPIAGNTSVKYTTSATATNSTNDWIASASITLDDKQKGNFVGFNFFYTWSGSDDLLCVIVWDDTNDAVLNDSTDCLETASNPTRYSLGVFIPTSTDAIKLGFHHTGASESSKILVFDDLELSSNPFVYKNLSEISSVQGEGNGSTVITGGVTNIDFTEVSDSDSAWNGTAYTIQKGNSIVSINGSVQFTSSTARALFLYKNGTSYKRIINDSGNSGEVLNFSYLSSRGEFDVDDAITIRTGGTGGTLANNSDRHYINIEERWEAEHVVTPAKNNIVSVEAYGNSGQSITSRVTDIPFAEVVDVDGAWDGDSYTVQSENSIITFHVNAFFTTSAFRYLELYVNGVFYKIIGTRVSWSSHKGSFSSIKGEFAKGDVLSIRSNGGGTLSNNTTLHLINITEHKDAQLLSAVPMNYTQTKILSADVTTNTTVSDLTFNNLVAGRLYQLEGVLRARINGDAAFTVTIDNSVTIAVKNFNTDGSNNSDISYGVSFKFKAVGTSVTFTTSSATATEVLAGDGTRAETFMQLTELNYTKETTRF